jgi:dienelactone hydrolase
VLDQSANGADALSALKLLASDPRIDASRIGVMGSRGGIVALETAIEPFRQGDRQRPALRSYRVFYPVAACATGARLRR